MQSESATWTAFEGERMVASGSKLDVVLALKQAGRTENVLIFDDRTGRQSDFDLSGSLEDVVARLSAGTENRARSRGRPKLGVVAREVTLLPRHWDWLNSQPGGASATLRKLVDAARKTDAGGEEKRQAQAAADRFMMAMLGDQPGYEEAARALYAGDSTRFSRLIAKWPADLKAHVERLAEPAFA
ncbi:DUF2239 family protein [Chelativorans sp. YIM 93263]|uniref:DUF2239 family protein n=1 Tax=Chelativorans sp. YIM 93263 TaxID=2906648 RepID=UPI00237887EF|nr:DUF2239 family protein [Chelativorans sp. YIM 93263]